MALTARNTLVYPAAHSNEYAAPIIRRSARLYLTNKTKTPRGASPEGFLYSNGIQTLSACAHRHKDKTPQGIPAGF